MTHAVPRQTAGGTTGALLLGLRVTAVATLVALLWQYVTAGNYSGAGDPTWLSAHSVGAIGVHVVAGLAMLAAAALWWRSGAPLWPAVLAGAVFVLTFVQALVAADMSFHIPGAMVLVVGAVTLAVWSFLPRLAPDTRA